MTPAFASGRQAPDIADLAGKTVLLRVDLETDSRYPDRPGETAARRIAPTVAALSAAGARTVVMTHFGEERLEPNPVYSVRPLADGLSRALGRRVVFIPDTVGTGAEAAVGALLDGDIAVLENLIFNSGETDNSRLFAIRLSVLGDLCVNDAPLASRRRFASTDAIAEFLPVRAGPHLSAENPAKPSRAAAQAAPTFSPPIEKV